MNAKEQKRIKSVLGNHYSSKIIAHLNRKEIFNADGNPFASGSIRKIVTGKQGNPTVEVEILKLVRIEEKRAENLRNQRTNLLKK